MKSRQMNEPIKFVRPNMTYSLKMGFGLELPTKRKAIEMANHLGVEVGTNCPRGGGSKCGGVTFLGLKDLGSTSMEIGIRQRGRQRWSVHNNLERIDLVFHGDSECSSLIEALRFAVVTLQDTMRTNRRKRLTDLLRRRLK